MPHEVTDSGWVLGIPIVRRKGPIYWVKGIEWVRKNRCPVSYNVNIIHLVINTFISTSTKNYIKQMSTYYFMVTSSLNMPKSNRNTLIDKKMCQFWRFKKIKLQRKRTIHTKCWLYVYTCIYIYESISVLVFLRAFLIYSF